MKSSPPRQFEIENLDVNENSLEQICLRESGQLVEVARNAARIGDLNRAASLFSLAVHKTDLSVPSETTAAKYYADFLFKTKQYQRMRDVLGYSYGRWAASIGTSDRREALRKLPIDKLDRSYSALIALSEVVNGNAADDLDGFLKLQLSNQNNFDDVWESIGKVRNKLLFMALLNVAYHGIGDRENYLKRLVELEPKNALANFEMGKCEMYERHYQSAAMYFEVAVKYGTKDLKHFATQKYYTASQCAKAWGPNGERRPPTANSGGN